MATKIKVSGRIAYRPAGAPKGKYFFSKSKADAWERKNSGSSRKSSKPRKTKSYSKHQGKKARPLGWSMGKDEVWTSKIGNFLMVQKANGDWELYQGRTKVAPDVGSLRRQKIAAAEHYALLGGGSPSKSKPRMDYPKKSYLLPAWENYKDEWTLNTKGHSLGVSPSWPDTSLWTVCISCGDDGHTEVAEFKTLKKAKAFAERIATDDAFADRIYDENDPWE
jgi:hypothetical protein